MTPFAPVPVLSIVTGEKPAPSAAAFFVDLADILEYGLFVQGMTRSGKTNLVRYIIEQSHGLVPIYILDIEGEYATLRTADRPFLVVGKGRDYELEPNRADVEQLVGDLVARRISAIFDLSEYEEEEMQLIIAAFCDAVVALPENHPGEKLVVLDELQEPAPEGGGKGTALNSVRRLSKRGLKRGFAMLGASQRTADVSNGVLTQLKSKAVGASDDADVPKALLQLGLGPRSRQAISELEQGEFWVKGPAFSRHAVHVRVPRAESSPARRRRGEGAAPASKASGEIAELAATLAAAAAERARLAAEQEAARATRQRRPEEASDAAAAVDVGALEAERQAGRDEERARQRRLLQPLCTTASFSANHLRELASQILERAGILDGVVEESGCGWTGVVVQPDPAEEERRVREIMLRPASGVAVPAPTPELARAERTPIGQRLLDALARLDALGIRQAPRDQVAAFASATPTSSATERAFAKLLRECLIEAPTPGVVKLTLPGRATAVPSAVPPTLVEYHARWCELLDPAPAKLLDAMVRMGHRASHPRQALAEAAGLTPTSSATERAFATLVRLTLFDVPMRGVVKGSALLFPEGLR